MAKFKFKSTRKTKFNFIKNKSEILNQETITGSHIEFFSNKKVIIEGCQNIIDYENNYLCLKLNKNYLKIFGSDFFIKEFDNKKIQINGNVQSIEFMSGD